MRVFYKIIGTVCLLSLINKQAVLSQGNRTMPQLFFSV